MLLTYLTKVWKKTEAILLNKLNTSYTCITFHSLIICHCISYYKYTFFMKGDIKKKYYKCELSKSNSFMGLPINFKS